MSAIWTDRAIRLLAVIVGLVGLYAGVEALQGFYQLVVDSTFGGWEDIFAWLFIGMLCSAMLGICGLAIHTAVGAWKQITVSRVRRLAAIAAIVLWLQLGVLLDHPSSVFPPPDPLREALTDICLLVVSVLSYLFLSRLLIAKSSLEPGLPQPAPRAWIGLFCLLLCLDMFNVADALLGSQPRHPRILWKNSLSLLVPILLAWLLYKLIVHFMDRPFRRHQQRIHSMIVST